MKLLALWLLLAAPGPGQSDRLAEADAFYRKGDFHSAARAYQEIIQPDASNEKAQTGLIRSLLKNNRVEEAHIRAVEAQGTMPSSSAIVAAMGDVLIRNGDFSNAAERYATALQTNPGNSRAYLGMAKLHSANFNRKSMRTMHRKAYENDPEDPEILFAFATDLPAAQQIPLLEKYLELAQNETQYRRDLASERLGFLKEMGHRPTWLLQGDPRTATVELRQILPAPGRPSGYKMRVGINGHKPVDLQLDTGARGLTIDRKLAEKLGVAFVSESTIRGVGDEGKRKAFLGLAASVRFGDLEFRDCTIDVSEKKLIGETRGLVGIDIFQQFLISLDLPKYELRLEPLPPLQGRRYDDPESWNEFDRPIVPELRDFAPILRWGHLLLDTTVNGTSRGFFYLDTGASANLISLALAKKVTSLESDNTIVRGLSGKVKDVSVARRVLLQVGRFRQQNDGMIAINFNEMSRDLGLEVSGLLGHPLLSRLSITVDYRDGLLNLAYPGEERGRRR